METNHNYTCPSCSKECAVAESLTGQNVICPNCSNEFFATPPADNSQVIIPEKLPFFKSGRLKILEQRLKELVADGELSDSDEDVLNKTAILLGLKASDLDEMERNDFLKEFSPIQRRIEQSWQMTDQDLEEIQALRKKYGVKKFTMAGNADLFRQIYLLDAKGQMPNAITADLMLDQGETAYFCVQSTWHQTRVHSHGYGGTSFSVPTGIKGVRFRFGQYTPIRSEEITALASGSFYVTNKRMLFHGDSRNTKVDLKKIADANIFSDCLKIEKYTGKPDFFSMTAAEARFVVLLIEKLRGAG
jgi:DNA-directed RNA polymerase subunit RPC12/RpoP